MQSAAALADFIAAAILPETADPVVTDPEATR